MKSLFKQAVQPATARRARPQPATAAQNRSAAGALWTRALDVLPLQAKLTVNQPGDEYEHEADRVAAHVMRMPDPAASSGRRCACGAIVTAGGECAACRAGRPGVQRKAERGTSADAPTSVHDTLRSPGRPLEAGTRGFMESRFGYDFGGVRVHTDAQAAASARAINAHAYTVGQNVVFADGRYAPTTSAGTQLLAHELTHVVQQGAGGGSRLQRQPSEAQIRQRIAEIEQQIASANLPMEDVRRLGDERNRLAGELQSLQRGSSSATPTSTPALGPQYVARPPGLPLPPGYELAQARDMPPDLANQIPEGQLVTVSLPQTPAASSGGPAVSAPVVALAELGGQMAGGSEAALLSSQVARPGGLLGSYSPFARPPTAAEQALIRAGRAFHYTPAQNVALIQQSGGSILLRPSPGIYRNLLTPGLEPSAYAFLGQPTAAQQAANLAGRGTLGQQALVIIEGADLPPGTLFRPLDRTIVVPRGYQGPGAVVAPGGQVPLPLRSPGATGATAAEGAAAQSLTRFQVLRWGGRFFIVVGVVATGYEIAVAPPAERTRTAVGATSGFVGGLAAGAAAGLLCGPGAPVCSVVLGLTFGLAGGLAARSAAEGIYDIAAGP